MTAPAFGGTGCPSTSQSDGCGEIKGGVLISAETGTVVVLKQDTNSTVMIYSYTVVRSKVNMQVSKTLHTANTPRVF